MTQARAIIVAGPTASGKSALALWLAERLGGTVINADAMQCYAELRIVTARPTPEDEARVPHRLYGVLPAARAGHVAWWREAALEAMAAAAVPILCGGTGMYLRALTQGLSALPEVPPEVRGEARAALAELGASGLHARLHPADRAVLRPSDAQRIARAFEVWRATGQSLSHWQETAPRLAPAPHRFRAILLDPPRPTLRASIERRWEDMLAQGARAEVAALLAQNLDPALPAMRAHGVPELLAHLRGAMPLAAARERAVLNTGQYTKRQATWFRHHKLADPSFTHIIHARMDGQTQFQESVAPKIFAFVQAGR